MLEYSSRLPTKLCEKKLLADYFTKNSRWVNLEDNLSFLSVTVKIYERQFLFLTKILSTRPLTMLQIP